MTIVWTNDTTVLPIEFHIYDVNPEQNKEWSKPVKIQLNL